SSDLAGQRVELVARERPGLDEQGREQLRLDVAGLPEVEPESVVGLELLGEGADVAELHAELVVGRAGLRVVLAAGLVAHGFETGEDVVHGHGVVSERGPGPLYPMARAEGRSIPAAIGPPALADPTRFARRGSRATASGACEGVFTLGAGFEGRTSAPRDKECGNPCESWNPLPCINAPATAGALCFSARRGVMGGALGAPGHPDPEREGITRGVIV